MQVHLWYCLEHLHLQKGRKCTQVTEGREGEERKENIVCLMKQEEFSSQQEVSKNEHTNEEQLLFSDWLQTRIS